MSRFQAHMNVITAQGKANMAEFKVNRAMDRPLTPGNAVKVFVAGVRSGRAKAHLAAARRKI